MFVQIIQGKVTDPAAFKTRGEVWQAELAPGAIGYLGSTTGVTEDGTAIVIARFESAEAAQRNSDRPEQGQWWAQTSKLFGGEATFSNSEEVFVDLVGDPNSSEFVQVIQGHVKDVEPVRKMASQGSSSQWAAFRPDVIGSVTILHADNAYTMVLYFTTEAEARVGEKQEIPEALMAEMAEMEGNEVGTPTFLDLTDPWLSVT